MAKYNEEILDGVRACISDKDKPNKCIDKVMDEHDLDAEDKGKILTKLIKED